MPLFRRPSGLLLILLALLTVPSAAVAWEDPSPNAEAREAFPSRPPAAPSVVSQTIARAAWTPLLPSRLAAGPAASPPVRTSIRVLTGRLNQ